MVYLRHDYRGSEYRFSRRCLSGVDLDVHSSCGGRAEEGLPSSLLCTARYIILPYVWGVHNLTASIKQYQQLTFLSSLYFILIIKYFMLIISPPRIIWHSEAILTFIFLLTIIYSSFKWAGIKGILQNPLRNYRAFRSAINIAKYPVRRLAWWRPAADDWSWRLPSSTSGLSGIINVN